MKKAYRFFFPKVLSKSEILERRLRANLEIVKFENLDVFYKITLKNNTQVYLRGDNSSDVLVFEQIFNFKEYQLIFSILSLNMSPTNVIIDAGANVGYTSVFFASQLKNCTIFAIEPSYENTEVFNLNTEIYQKKSIIKLYNNALSHIKGLKFEIDNNFRDGKDWALSTKETENGKVTGITLQEIIQENGIKEIDFLKIDIEGAERFIFDENSDLSFLKVTKIIAIEIHDEFVIRDKIMSILMKNNFMLLESGELTIGLNKALI